MTRILVLSDTHIPRVAHDLPKKVYDAIETVDLILHAGDFVEKDLLDKLMTLKDTRAVYGNMDGQNLHHLLKQKEIIKIGGFRIGLIHGYGAPRDLVETVAAQFKDVEAIVFGHSHAALNEMRSGVLFFNPGSPTDTIFASYNSFGILEVSDKGIRGEIVPI